jgi:hypothetical protein
MPKPQPPRNLTGAKLKQWFKDNNWSAQEQQNFLTNRIETADETADPSQRQIIEELEYPWLGKPFELPGRNIPTSSKSGQPDMSKRPKKDRFADIKGLAKPLGERPPKFPDEQTAPSVGGGGSGTGLAAETVTPIGGAEQKTEIPPFMYDDSDLKYQQRLYDYYSNQEVGPKFQFDDTYAPDSAGFRDYAGYLGDIGKTVIGAIGASKKLEDYDPSSDFKTMITESRDRRNLGLSQADRAQSYAAMDRAYNYDVTNIRNMSGGSGGAALANLGGAANRFYGAQNQLTALDQQLKMQNRQQFNQAAMAGEQVNQFGFQEKRGREMLNKQAAAGLMQSSMENIRQRKEYEDTYLNPDSPYYQYRKELTLDTRQNRELKEYAEQERVREAEQFRLDQINQSQERIAEIERGREKAYVDYKKKAEAEGYSLPIQSAEDFNNWDGQPIIGTETGDNYVPPVEGKPSVGLAKTISDVSANMNETIPEFGYSRNEMNKMSDEDLKKEGIERSTQKIEYTDPNTGKTETKNITNYGLSQPMDQLPGEATTSDQEYLNLETEIDKEYSSKEDEIRNQWYLKNEKKYNKLMKELQSEKREALRKRQEEYLKK